jgi:hypothetical protein
MSLIFYKQTFLIGIHESFLVHLDHRAESDASLKHRICKRISSGPQKKAMGRYLTISLIGFLKRKRLDHALDILQPSKLDCLF